MCLTMKSHNLNLSIEQVQLTNHLIDQIGCINVLNYESDTCNVNGLIFLAIDTPFDLQLLSNAIPIAILVTFKYFFIAQMGSGSYV